MQDFFWSGLYLSGSAKCTIMLIDIAGLEPLGGIYEYVIKLHIVRFNTIRVYILLIIILCKGSIICG